MLADQHQAAAQMTASNVPTTAGLAQGEAEGDKRPMDWLGWRGLLEGVCQLVNDQLAAALNGSQQMLARQHQVT